MTQTTRWQPGTAVIPAGFCERYTIGIGRHEWVGDRPYTLKIRTWCVIDLSGNVVAHVTARYQAEAVCQLLNARIDNAR